MFCPSPVDGTGRRPRPAAVSLPGRASEPARAEDLWYSSCTTCVLTQNEYWATHCPASLSRCILRYCVISPQAAADLAVADSLPSTRCRPSGRNRAMRAVAGRRAGSVNSGQNDLARPSAVSTRRPAKRCSSEMKHQN